MDVDKIINKAEKKAQKITVKNEKRLKIIEENVELTPEERITLYKKMLKKLDSTNKRLKRRYDFKEKLTYISQKTAKDKPTNFLTGLLGTLGVLVGVVGLFTGSSEVLNILSGASVVVGSILTTNSALNSELLGDSKIDEIGTKLMYDRSCKTGAIDGVCKKLNSEIFKNQELINGRNI